MSTTAALCNNGNTRSLTVNVPRTDAADILRQFNNPNGIGWLVFIETGINTNNHLVASNYAPQLQSPDSIRNPAAGDYLIINSTNVFQNNAANFTFNNLPVGAYVINIHYYGSLYYDSNGLTNVNPGNLDDSHTTQIAIASSVPGCGCTDPIASNYNTAATTDDQTCIYLSSVGGCMDSNATNFKSFATFDDGSCEYGDINACISGCEGVTTVVPACIPNEINQLLDYNKKCIAASGNRYYTKHITGLSDSCSNMDSWKMIIIDDLMSRKGLPCLYNCTDASTPSLEDSSIDCLQIWKDSGSREWDPAHVGTYRDGAVVLRNNAVYTATGDSGLDIDPVSNNESNGWKKCNDLAIRNEAKDYLPNFLKFAAEHCKDCDIPSYRQDDPQAVQISESYSVGGKNFTINGSTLNT